MVRGESVSLHWTDGFKVRSDPSHTPQPLHPPPPHIRTQRDRHGRDGKISYDEFFARFFDEGAATTSDAVVNKKRLTAADVYVRIRPLAASGGHSAAADPSGNKTKISVKSWDEDKVVLQEARGEVKYKFMRKVILPEATQKEMYDACAAHYDEAITMQLTDCMMLAYGQTGTGKTHTICSAQRNPSSLTWSIRTGASFRASPSPCSSVPTR